MGLRRVQGMPLMPHTCLLCGQGPTSNDGATRDVIFAEGVDVDWGNSVYICWECAELIADLVKRVTREGFDKLEATHEALTTEHAELLGKYTEQEETLDTIRRGSAAVKKVKAA